MHKTLILGVGNTWRGDDGIGPAVIQELQKQHLASVDLHDGAIDGLTLLEVIKDYQRAIIVDAVDMRLDPGTVKIFTPNEASINITSDALSTHGFGLAEVINLIPKLDIKTHVTIIGVQPKTIEFGQKLSKEVTDKISYIVNNIKKLL